MAVPVADLFDRFHLAIYRYLLRMTGRRDVAEDLTQDVFVRLLGTGSVPDQAGAERAWLFQVARNLLIDWQRRAARNPVGGSTDTLADASGAVEARQDIELHVREALARLPETDREAFLLRVVVGLGHDEIAVMTATTAPSVRSRIFRARSSLRRMLASSLPHRSETRGGEVRPFKVLS